MGGNVGAPRRLAGIELQLQRRITRLTRTPARPIIVQPDRDLLTPGIGIGRLESLGLASIGGRCDCGRLHDYTFAPHWNRVTGRNIAKLTLIFAFIVFLRLLYELRRRFLQAGGELLFAGIIAFRINQHWLARNFAFNAGLESGFHHEAHCSRGASECGGKPHGDADNPSAFLFSTNIQSQKQIPRR